jgi:hypothetical protein
MSETMMRVRTNSAMGREGHITFGWEKADDEWVEKMIQKKMSEGHVFWIVRSSPMREERLTRVKDINDDRHVVIRDPDARKLFEQGKIGIMERPRGAAQADDDKTIEPMRRAASAAEAARSDTVSHAQARGG